MVFASYYKGQWRLFSTTTDKPLHAAEKTTLPSAPLLAESRTPFSAAGRGGHRSGEDREAERIQALHRGCRRQRRRHLGSALRLAVGHLHERHARRPPLHRLARLRVVVLELRFPLPRPAPPHELGLPRLSTTARSSTPSIRASNVPTRPAAGLPRDRRHRASLSHPFDRYHRVDTGVGLRGARHQLSDRCRRRSGDRQHLVSLHPAPRQLPARHRVLQRRHDAVQGVRADRRPPLRSSAPTTRPTCKDARRR